MRLIATPRSGLSWSYDVRAERGGAPVAVIEIQSFRTGYTIQVGDVPYAFRQADWLGRRYTLSFEEVALAEARRPSVWTNRIGVTFEPGFLDPPSPPLRLLPMGATQSTQIVQHQRDDGWEDIGDIKKRGLFSRALHSDLPTAMPLAVQVFLTAVVVAEMRRRQSS